jgi:hypothetical protein
MLAKMVVVMDNLKVRGARGTKYIICRARHCMVMRYISWANSVEEPVDHIVGFEGRGWRLWFAYVKIHNWYEYWGWGGVLRVFAHLSWF